MAFLGIIMGLAALSESMEKAKLGNKKTGKTRRGI